MLGALLLLYPAAVHWSLLAGRNDLALSALLVLCLAFVTMYFSTANRIAATPITIVAILLLLLGASFINHSSFPVVLLPPAINVGLCWMFGRTLRHGSDALITRFARLIEGENLPTDVVRYTRTVTFVWCLAFGALALEAALLAVLAPPEIWSLFAHGINHLFVAAVFVAEYTYRRWRFRDRPHLSPLRFLKSLAAADWQRLSLR